MSKDTRWHKEKMSRLRLRKVVKFLERYSPQSVTDEVLLSIKMTRDQFKFHKEKERKFQEALAERKTYDSVRLGLEKEALQTLKRVITIECKRRNKSKVKTIQKLARGLKPHVPWLPEQFNASRFWCQEIRSTLIAPRRQRNKNLEFEQWVMEQIETHGELETSAAQTKCNELLGEKSAKAWESFSRRTRLKLGLESTSKERSKRNPVWIKR